VRGQRWETLGRQDGLPASNQNLPVNVTRSVRGSTGWK
jgi:hypothetical protein